MYWSVSAIGKAPAVAIAIEKQFVEMTYPCPEPEESVKQLVRQAIAALLAGQTRPDTAVKVSASGSQSHSTKRDVTSGKDTVTDCTNQLTLTFETIYGFTE